MTDKDGERFESECLNAKKKTLTKAACPVTKHELYVDSHF